MNKDDGTDEWETQFSLNTLSGSSDLAQIKREIILNNFEERLMETKIIYTCKWEQKTRFLSFLFIWKFHL